jgi:putative colanic acid biosynthesis glycosyltransferase
MINKTLSIVTVHFNDFHGLERTLNSIQTLKKKNPSINIEWIIIDGGSDFSEFNKLYTKLEIISNRFISEPDEGIYDAMNKGLKLATKDWVIFMNAGDTFCDNDFLVNMFDRLKLIDDTDIVYASAYEGTSQTNWALKNPRSPSYLWWGMPTHHQAIVFRTKVAKEFYYDTGFSIAADYKLVSQVSLYSKHVLVMDIPLCHFDLTGLSTNNSNKGLEEAHLIRQDVLLKSNIANNIIWFLQKLIKSIKNTFPKLYASIRYK